MAGSDEQLRNMIENESNTTSESLNGVGRSLVRHGDSQNIANVGNYRNSQPGVGIRGGVASSSNPVNFDSMNQSLIRPLPPRRDSLLRRRKNAMRRRFRLLIMRRMWKW